MDMSGHLQVSNKDCRNVGFGFEVPAPKDMPKAALLRLAKLAAHSCGTQSAVVFFFDHQEVRCAGQIGVSEDELPFVTNLCSQLCAGGETMVVPDIRSDPRFAAGSPQGIPSSIRFIASTPVFIDDAQCIGLLCVFDSHPRHSNNALNSENLEDCASLISQIMISHNDKRLGEIAVKLVQASPDAVVAADRDGKIVYWNAGAEAMFGYPASHAVGQNVAIIVPENLKARHSERYQGAVDGNSTHRVGSFVEFEARHAKGHNFPVKLSLAPWGDEETDGGFTAVIRDISDRKQVERERKRISSFLDTVIQNLPAMLFVKDAETRKYVLVNRKAEALVGRTADSMIGYSDSELFPGIGEDYERRDAIAKASRTATVFESEFTRDDGEKRSLRTTRIVIDGPDRPRQFVLGMSEDTTKIRAVEDENRRLARYDSLTGLLNRASFFERIRELIPLSHPFALFTIDLDRFKTINDQFGHPVGDEVLAVIAKRIEHLLSKTDMAARIGGDEFVAILTGEDLRQRAAEFGAQLVESVSQPIGVSGKVVHLGVSAGVVLHPEDATTIEELRQCSDLALYRAKSQGRGIVCFFESEMYEAARQQQKLEAALRLAIENKEIFLQYQPVVCVKTQEVTSVEALARWDLEGTCPIPPEVFIPLAEDCGLIDELGRQLLFRACEEAGDWRSDIKLAVNLSPMQFRSGKLISTVRDALGKSGFPASRLMLEVTERQVIKQPEQTFEQLELLRSLGIQILLDDFGVGQSSLSYFQHFPFDKIKIDKSFTDEIETSHAARSIVEAVVGLGRNLSIATVAEGVETESQSKLLTSLGCSHLQGFLFSKPLDPSLVDKFVVSCLADTRD